MMNKYLRNTVAAATLVILSAGVAKAEHFDFDMQDAPAVTRSTNFVQNDAQFERLVKTDKGTAQEVKTKEDSPLKTVMNVGNVVIEELNGTFIEDYMKVAKAVEAKVDAAMELRREQGLKANKLHEIGYRIKYMFPMLKFVATRAILPILKVIL